MAGEWNPRDRKAGLDWRTVRSLQAFSLFFLMACGGGGCGGCDCVAPIPGGFPIAERVENSAQVRITEGGIEFLEDNIDSLLPALLPDGLEFDIPRTVNGSGLLQVTICTTDDCKARIEIEEFDLEVQAPNRLVASVRVILDSRGPDGMIRGIPTRTRLGTCDINLDTRGNGRDYVGFIANIDFETETQPARSGYTRLVVNNARIAEGEGFQNQDISVSGCFISGLLNLARGPIVDILEREVSGILQTAIDEQLCTRYGMTGCPTGTFPRTSDDPETVCRYSEATDSECVPMLLGTDGQGDLGAAFLGSISPGTHAPGQFVLASGGDGEAIDNGLSLFMYGGFIGTNRDFTESPAHNPCVPLIDPPAIPTIPRAATFRGNSAPGIADPDIGIGLSESFLNHAGYGMFDGGLLCIGAGTSLSQQLSTGLFSALIRSLGDLAFPQSAAPIAIGLRPQRPPTFEVGSGGELEPLLTIGMEQLQMDFYVWSSERFVRFMTYETDLSIPLDLEVEDGAVVPRITEINATNSTVSNSELLLEDPEDLASLIQGVLTMFADMFTSGLGGFELPALAGIELDIPEGGIQGVVDGGEEFLAIFANLGLAPPMALSAPVDTEMQIGELILDPHSMQVESWNQGALPQLDVHIDAFGPHSVDYEYSYRVDGRSWSPWTSEADFVIEDEMLLFQARHLVETRARIAGEPQSADTTPASVEVLVDILEPQVVLTTVAEGTEIRALDVLTESENLDIRFRAPGGEWNEWSPIGDDTLVIELVEAEVEVRDDAGNIGHATNAIIRGVPNPSAASDCACTVPGGGSTGPSSLGWFAFLGFVFAWRRRRRSFAWRRGSKGKDTSTRARRFPVLPLLVLSLALGGCDCGGEGPVPDGGFDTGGDTNGMDTNVDMGPLAPLDEGILATYLDMEASAAGTIYMSGYSAGVPGGSPYGDLVVTRYSETGVDWQIIDGAPSEPITADPTGWRGGVRAPGDDVGRWTSLALDGETMLIAYEDVTNTALKFASGTIDGGFSVHTVDDSGLAGEHTSIVKTPSGVAVSYLAITPVTALPGRPTSTLRVATASGTPSGPGDWTVTDVVSAEIPCRPQYCPEGSACTVDGECVMETADCAEDCGDQTCVAGACVDTLGSSWVEDHPVALGLYSRLANTASGLAMVYYDRTAGDISGVSFDGSAWGAPFLIDGYSRPLDPSDSLDVAGDSGIGASLAVDDAGVWHVTYVDGAEERLRYARVESGAVVALETIDDGSTDGMTRHSDGRHIVGDDSSVVVTSTGEVRVAYQDATAQRVVLARRTGDDAWAIAVIDDEGSAGYWTRQILMGTTSHVGHWWRIQGRGDAAMNGVRVVTAE